MAGQRKLSARQTLFCDHYARAGDPLEAALRAGYRPGKAGETAARLLGRGDIRAEIGLRREEARAEAADLALAGLMRLALGGIGDAAKLVSCGEPPAPGQLAGMDLFAVSELRSAKNGGMEVRLHDRLQALELLLKYAGNGGGGGRRSIYEALERSARALGKDGGEDGCPERDGCEADAL